MNRALVVALCALAAATKGGMIALDDFIAVLDDQFIAGLGNLQQVARHWLVRDSGRRCRRHCAGKETGHDGRQKLAPPNGQFG